MKGLETVSKHDIHRIEYAPTVIVWATPLGRVFQPETRRVSTVLGCPGMSWGNLTAMETMAH